MRQTDEEERERDRTENTLAALAAARLALEHAGHRLHPTGGPSSPSLRGVLDELDEAYLAILRAQGYIGEEWRKWQRERGYHNGE